MKRLGATVSVAPPSEMHAIGVVDPLVLGFGS